MCGGVEARDAEKAYKVYFPSPKAAFPVMLEGGEALGWVTWGRRREEPGQGPQGGWARPARREGQEAIPLVRHARRLRPGLLGTRGRRATACVCDYQHAAGGVLMDS